MSIKVYLTFFYSLTFHLIITKKFFFFFNRQFYECNKRNYEYTNGNVIFLSYCGNLPPE